jgi:hypothetical protein
MANFNYGIDCEDDTVAEKLFNYIESLEIYQDGLDQQDERVTLISKQGIIPDLEKWAKANNTQIDVEVWPEDKEYDEAEEAGELEVYNYG